MGGDVYQVGENHDRRRCYPENNDKRKSFQDEVSYPSRQSQHARKQVEEQRFILAGVRVSRPQQETGKKRDTREKKYLPCDCRKCNKNHLDYRDDNRPLKKMVLLISCQR